MFTNDNSSYTVTSAKLAILRCIPSAFHEGRSQGEEWGSATSIFISLELEKCVLNPPKRAWNEFQNVPLARSQAARMCDLTFKRRRHSRVSYEPLHTRRADKQKTNFFGRASHRRYLRNAEFHRLSSRFNCMQGLISALLGTTANSIPKACSQLPRICEVGFNSANVKNHATAYLLKRIIAQRITFI